MILVVIEPTTQNCVCKQYHVVCVLTMCVHRSTCTIRHRHQIEHTRLSYVKDANENF